jgi:hypothetical protein
MTNPKLESFLSFESFLNAEVPIGDRREVRELVRKVEAAKPDALETEGDWWGVIALGLVVNGRDRLAELTREKRLAELVESKVSS